MPTHAISEVIRPRAPDHDFLLLTTTDVRSSDRQKELDRLIESVLASASGGVKIIHFILFQRCARVLIRNPDPNVFVFKSITEQVSLSRARNILLQGIRYEQLLEKSAYLAFPDDDAWYPPGNLRAIKDFLDANPSLGVFGCDYGSNPVAGIKEVCESTSRFPKYIRMVSSNTLIVRGDVATAIGNFDEKLGIGAELNGGEDTEYAVRAFIASRGRVALCPLKLVGHRDRQQWIRGRYYTGALIALCRYASESSVVALQAMRKIAVGFYLVLRREIKMRTYCRALLLGLAAYQGRLQREG